MMSQPDLKLLSTFLVVVREGSMADAAAALGYVPSAVSQHVAVLERSLGVELIARRPGSRLALTAAGRALAGAAEVLFDATARFQDAAREIADGALTEVRVGTYPSAMTYLMPGVVSALGPRYASSDIRFVDVETAQGLPLVRSGDLDLLIAYRYLPEDPPTASESWAVTTLGDEPMVLLAATVAARGHPLRLADCLDRDWVSGHPHNPDRRLLMRWASQIGIAPRVTLETEDLHSTLAMIRAGHVVGLVPATLLSSEEARRGLERVALAATGPPLRREILAVSRPGKLPVIVEEILGLLSEALQRVAAAAAAMGPPAAEH